MRTTMVPAGGAGIVEFGVEVPGDFQFVDHAGGLSLDASVRISGSDRAGRERLLRYCARAHFALEPLRIECAPATRLADHAKRRLPVPRVSALTN